VESDILARLREAIIGDSDEQTVVDIANQIVAEGVDINLAIDAATEAIQTVGDLFGAGEVFLPKLMIGGRQMERFMSIVSPHVEADGGVQVRGRVLIGTVFGDIHDLGKNLVATMLRVTGFDVSDVGVNVRPVDFVTAAQERTVDIIALSCLMTNALPYQQEVVDVLVEMGLRERFYVIIGGGPVTPEFAEEIKADGWAENAAGATELCQLLLESGKEPPLAKPLLVRPGKGAK
jgi:methylmalonyl-CoA mutase cobalamin-binding domain/chain